MKQIQSPSVKTDGNLTTPSAFGVHPFNKLKGNYSLLPSAFLLFCFSALLHFSGIAQTDKEKELLQMEQEVASGKLSDDEIFEKYYNLIYEYSERGDIEKIKFYFNNAVAFAREKRKVNKESMFFTLIGESYAILREPDSAMIYLEIASKLIEGKEFNKEKYSIYKAKGSVYDDLGDYENAIASYLKALEYNEKDLRQKEHDKQSIEQNLHNKRSVLNNMGNVYGMMFMYDKQIEIYL